MTFTTRSGSRYELDAEGRRVRRLGGSTEPTPRQGIDGRWREYVDATAVRVGHQVLFIWEHCDISKGTLTSPVTTVEEGAGE